jgi:hypothetical protein
MLEMLLCSLVTLLPDYLYRRYVQGSGSARRLLSTRFGSSSGGELRAASF